MIVIYTVIEICEYFNAAGILTGSELFTWQGLRVLGPPDLLSGDDNVGTVYSGVHIRRIIPPFRDVAGNFFVWGPGTTFFTAN